MEELYNVAKKDIKEFVQTLDAKSVIGYANTFGKLMGLERLDGRVYVSPQYVIASHFLYPSYTGRMVLFASTAVFLFGGEIGKGK